MILIILKNQFPTKFIYNFFFMKFRLKWNYYSIMLASDVHELLAQKFWITLYVVPMIATFWEPKKKNDRTFWPNWYFVPNKSYWHPLGRQYLILKCQPLKIIQSYSYFPLFHVLSFPAFDKLSINSKKLNSFSLLNLFFYNYK